MRPRSGPSIWMPSPSCDIGKQKLTNCVSSHDCPVVGSMGGCTWGDRAAGGVGRGDVVWTSHSTACTADASSAAQRSAAFWSFCLLFYSRHSTQRRIAVCSRSQRTRCHVARTGVGASPH